MSTRDRPNSVSVVIPVFNEAESIEPLYEALTNVLSCLGRSYEIIFVDDGSRDGSAAKLSALADADPRLRVVEFRRNFGQTSALRAGIQHASGDVVVTLDADLQMDPADIPMLLTKIDDGYDLVHGWRKERSDPYLSRILPSRVANALIAKVTGFRAHDLGCSLKAVRREIALELGLYGEMHRFIPILAHWRGARCVEVVTRHRPRRFGVSKYGIARVVRVMLDLVMVEYLIRYLVSPMKLFGMLGLVCGLVGLSSGVATVVMKVLQGVNMTGNPLLLLSVFSVMVGVQFFGFGVLAELGARVYFEVKNQNPHAIRRTRNLGHGVHAEVPSVPLAAQSPAGFAQERAA